MKSIVASLVPRPSPAPVFDRFKRSKTGALQAIKNWSQGRPGNEARLLQPLRFQNYDVWSLLWWPRSALPRSIRIALAGPQLYRILSALCPHYSRSPSAPFPQHLRKHCFFLVINIPCLHLLLFKVYPSPLTNFVSVWLQVN